MVYLLGGVNRHVGGVVPAVMARFVQAAGIFWSDVMLTRRTFLGGLAVAPFCGFLLRANEEAVFEIRPVEQPVFVIKTFTNGTIRAFKGDLEARVVSDRHGWMLISGPGVEARVRRVAAGEIQIDWFRLWERR